MFLWYLLARLLSHWKYSQTPAVANNSYKILGHLFFEKDVTMSQRMSLTLKTLHDSHVIIFHFTALKEKNFS